jgi:periodic tryptophan protein 2
MPEGILLYSLDSTALFDPTDLAEDVSRPSVFRLLGRGDTLKAILVAVRLNDDGLLLHALLSAPVNTVHALAAALPPNPALHALAVLAPALASTPHLQFMLRWVRSLFEAHGSAFATAARASTMPVLREVQRSMAAATARLAGSVEQCMYKLAYLAVAPAAVVEVGE